MVDHFGLECLGRGGGRGAEQRTIIMGPRGERAGVDVPLGRVFLLAALVVVASGCLCGRGGIFQGVKKVLGYLFLG